jgi:hypothetical protein
LRFSFPRLSIVSSRGKFAKGRDFLIGGFLMSTQDTDFTATGPGQFGFDSDPSLQYGVRGRGQVTGVFGMGTAYGVFGQGIFGVVAEGSSQAVRGTSDSGVGIYGQSNAGTGIFGQSGTPSLPTGSPIASAGVFGWADIGHGVAGVSRLGNGVSGESTELFGVIGESINSTGVMGGSANGAGVRGESNNGPGVAGASPNRMGVEGVSINGTGVVGLSRNGTGVIGESINGIGVEGVVLNGAAVRGTIQLAGNGALAGVFDGPVFIGDGLEIDGPLTVYGHPKSAAVPFPDGSHRLLYCMESPELWFEDFGSAKLRRGRATVTLNDFANVIATGDYRVFLSPEGDCNGLYVARKRRAAFEVREFGGGRSSVAFSYRIVGRRKDIKGRRRFAKFEKAALPPAPSKIDSSAGTIAAKVTGRPASSPRKVRALSATERRLLARAEKATRALARPSRKSGRESLAKRRRG